MSYLDWGQLDLSAAIDCIRKDDKPTFVVGHSYGGQALGLTHNHDQVTAMYCFGTGAGWHGYMPFRGENESTCHVESYFPADGCTKGLSALEPAENGHSIYLWMSTHSGENGVKIRPTFLQIPSNNTYWNSMHRSKLQSMLFQHWMMTGLYRTQGMHLCSIIGMRTCITSILKPMTMA